MAPMSAPSLLLIEQADEPVGDVVHATDDRDAPQRAIGQPPERTLQAGTHEHAQQVDDADQDEGAEEVGQPRMAGEGMAEVAKSTPTELLRTEQPVHQAEDPRQHGERERQRQEDQQARPARSRRPTRGRA